MMNEKFTPLYFESHVTISPVFDERLEEFKKTCKIHGFHVAKLLMEKRRSRIREFVPSDHDSFCTGRDQDYDALERRMIDLINALNNGGFKLLRYKIEVAVLDSRKHDVFGLLV